MSDFSDSGMGGVVLAEEHNTDNVDYGGDAAVRGASERRPSEPWDAAEYGMTLAQAQARFDAAQTPEARAKVVADLKARALARADLDNSTGRVAVMVAGPEAAWHKLGVQVSEAQTSAAAMVLAGLDWKVAKQQLFLADGRAVKGAWAMLRQDTDAVLGTVGERYVPYQNAECFAFIDSLVGEKLAMYETAGAFSGGRKVWMMVRLPKEYRVAGTDDVVNPYVLLSNSHDGTGALSLMPTGVRVCCANTHRLAVSKAGQKGASEFTLRHSKNLERKVSDARRQLGVVAKGFEGFMEQAGVMAKFAMKTTAVDAYFTNLFPTEVVKLTPSQEFVTDVLREKAEREAKKNQEVVDQLHDLFVNDKNSLKGMAGSAWAAYNSVSEYVDHVKTSRGKDDAARLENRAINTLFGSGQLLKAQAFNNAFNLTQAV